jgi:phosphatidylserine decarboxylase
MTTVRGLLFTLLPKRALSCVCGWLCSTPLPRPVRVRLFRWFARRYGASLDEVALELGEYRSLQAFFRRALRPGARPVAASPLVWPCDGKIVTTGAIAAGRIEQVKGNTYSLEDFVGDSELAKALDGGSQATIYLAPGDYHRVHSPFAAKLAHVRALPGTLFPVNPPAVRGIDNLFVRNSRHVFRCRLPNGLAAAVVMVGAYNVGGTTVTRAPGDVAAGDEIGQFGFGSTVVVLVAAGGPTFPLLAPETRVRMGAGV